MLEKFYHCLFRQKIKLSTNLIDNYSAWVYAFIKVDNSAYYLKKLLIEYIP